MTARTLAALLHDRSGVAALELGLVAIPLLMISLGCIEFGRFAWTQEALQSAATAGVRCIGLKAPSCISGGSYNASNAATYVVNVAADWNITLPSADVTTSNTATCAGLTGFSSVSISYKFQTPIPVLIEWMSNGVIVTTNACFPNQS